VFAHFSLGREREAKPVTATAFNSFVGGMELRRLWDGSVLRNRKLPACFLRQMIQPMTRTGRLQVSFKRNNFLQVRKVEKRNVQNTDSVSEQGQICSLWTILEETAEKLGTGKKWGCACVVWMGRERVSGCCP
jgi:hypothetical protein